MKRRAIRKGSEEDEEGGEEEIPKETRRDLQPFPNNKDFVSQPVLSDVFRDEIWKAIMEQGKLVRDVSAELGVDMARVGAVVRLKEIEKEWKRIVSLPQSACNSPELYDDIIKNRLVFKTYYMVTNFSMRASLISSITSSSTPAHKMRQLLTQLKGKPLAIPYHNALMGMLPITQYKSEIIRKDDDDKNKEKGYIQPHESINDLIMHPATFPQIFHPTSESRVFTRADAAKVFDDHLLPADDRVPHPELALMHKDLKAKFKHSEILERQAERDRKAEEMRQYYLERKAKRQPAVKEVHGRRWEFKFTEVNSDDIGKDGRGHKGVGWRYGTPFMDRSRGHVKIPTRVD